MPQAAHEHQRFLPHPPSPHDRIAGLSSSHTERGDTSIPHHLPLVAVILLDVEIRL